MPDEAKHVRGAVRRAIATALSGEAFEGIAVYANRSRPIGLSGDGKKAIEILIPRETSKRIGSCETNQYQRIIEVHIIGYATATDNDIAADAVDEIATKIETAMGADSELGGIAVDSWLSATDFVLDAAAYANASFSQTWNIEVTKDLLKINS